MERKWDINLVANKQAPRRDILQRALNVVGVNDAALASTIEDSILDWCNPNAPASFSGAKDDYYTRLKPAYYCKSGAMDDLSELLLIKAITPDIYWGSLSTNHPVPPYQQHGGGALDLPANVPAARLQNKDEPMYQVGLEQLFSPLGGRLNINTASSLALQLLPGVDASAAQRILEQRAGPDGVDGTDDDAPFHSVPEFLGVLGMPPTPAQGLAAYVDVRSSVFDVRVETEINGYKRTYHGVVSRNPRNPQTLQCVKFYWD